MDTINTIGRRKTSVARVYMDAGKGEIKVNDKSIEEFFPAEVHQIIVKQPLAKVEETETFNFHIVVKGGGMKGQAEAIRLGIARALIESNEDHRPALKSEGFLTRDSRMVERKKYGRRKARRRFQFSKR